MAQQFLITTQNGHTFVVDTQLNKLVTISIQSHLPQTRVQYLGLACSPNKVIFASITSPNTVYDHLVTREPSIIHIFTLRGATCDPLSIIDNSPNLGSIWDCMEVLRLKAAKANDPSEVFSSTPRELESLSFYKLQISLWMTVMRNVCMTKKSIPNVDYIRECKLTKELSLIFLHSTCAYLENSIKKNILSEDETSAASQLRRYLEIYQSGDEEEDTNVNRRIRKILNMTTSYPTQIEKCNLCDKVTDGMWYARSCPQGHKLPRCCTTLLQITLFEYRVCPICNQIFHPCLENMYEEPQCQYCDVPILRNLYDFDVENSELYGRNVSLPQFVDITESSRDPELEESSDKQRRNKWNTSHTYSVIVNDDEDESGRITEKWEEF